jgi:hypothetical protein
MASTKLPHVRKVCESCSFYCNSSPSVTYLYKYSKMICCNTYDDYGMSNFVALYKCGGVGALMPQKNSSSQSVVTAVGFLETHRST